MFVAYAAPMVRPAPRPTNAPPVQVRGKDLAEVLTPAYYLLAADDAQAPGEQVQPGPL